MAGYLTSQSRFMRSLRLNALSTGVLLLAACVCVLAGVLAYLARVETVSAHEQRSREVLAHSASLVASQIELAMDAGDTPRARRLLLDVQASRTFERVSLVDDGAAVLSTSQTGADIQDDVAAAIAGEGGARFDAASRRVVVLEPIDAAELGDAVLVAHSAAIAVPGSVRSLDLVIGVSGFAALLLVLLGVITRSQRLTGMFAIREALVAYAKGERETPILLVASRFGAHAQAFNDLLRERDELRVALKTAPESGGGGVVEQASTGVESMAWGAVPQGLIVLDASGRTRAINGAARALLGIDDDAGTDAVTSHETAGDKIGSLVEDLLVREHGRRRSVECQVGSDEDTTWVRATMVRLNDPKDPKGVLVLEDISQQKHSDDMLNAFIAQATHELRTPLTNIRMYAEEAVDSGAEDEAFRSNAFNMINGESRRLERIVSDMLCVSELEAGSMHVRLGAVHPKTIFDELERDYRPQAEMKGIKLVFDLPPKYPVMSADHDRVVQAIHNLLGNALKYTPEGGSVSVGVAFDAADTMTVKVTDSGIGISPEDQSRIFERFCRANDQRIGSISGTGLGLSISREIARMHDGDLTVESQLDHGSTFTLTIPSESASQSAAA